MGNFVKESLLFKLVAYFLLVALLPIAIVGYFSFRSAQEALQQTTLNDLSAARDRGERPRSRVSQANLWRHSISRKDPGGSISVQDPVGLSGLRSLP